MLLIVAIVKQHSKNQKREIEYNRQAAQNNHLKKYIYISKQNTENIPKNTKFMVCVDSDETHYKRKQQPTTKVIQK